MKDVKVKLTVKENVKPTFYRARPFSYVLKPAVGEELDKLVNQKIYEPVSHSGVTQAEWDTGS